jgi:hypothetical protein
MRIRSFLCLLLLLSALPLDASAKDLRGRFAVGFTNQLSPMTSASIKYTFPAKQPTVNIQLQGIAGMALYRARSQNDQFFAGFRMLFVFIAEDNLNAYAGAGAGYAGFSDGSRAVRAQPAVGLEFFLFGLENLGISAEFGVNIDVGISPSSGVDVTTGVGPDASSFGAVGLHYYF